jgi:hypothetical protein
MRVALLCPDNPVFRPPECHSNQNDREEQIDTALDRLQKPEAICRLIDQLVLETMIRYATVILLCFCARWIWGEQCVANLQRIY